jgi:hypothetical protein
MRAYADSSFILRLVTGEADSPQTIAEYRRLGSPKLFLVPLHRLEVRNAILLRAFHQRRSVASDERQQLGRTRDAALGRLDQLIDRGALLDVAVDLDSAIAKGMTLSTGHTERLGARAIDLLHVAMALILECELFLTTDHRQAQLAKAERLKVASVLAQTG